MKTNQASTLKKVVIGIFAVLSLAVLAGLLQSTQAARAASNNPEAGKTNYVNLCLTCHGERGKGDGPVGQYLTPKPSDLSKMVSERDDDYLFKVIKGGGASVGKSPSMPAWGGQLSKDEIENVISYIKTFSK